MNTINIPKDKRKYMQDLHFEHMQWNNQLNFFKEELGIFKTRLEEIVSRNTDNDVMREAEHFQNNFILQEEKVDEMLHNIKMHEQELVQYAKDHPVAVEHTYFENHSGLEEGMESFKKIYAELKEEYQRYLAKWM